MQLKVMFLKSFKHFLQMLHVVLWNYAKNDNVHVTFSKIETYQHLIFIIFWNCAWAFFKLNEKNHH
jgi:hypothetical protein